MTENPPTRQELEFIAAMQQQYKENRDLVKVCLNLFIILFRSNLVEG